MNRRSTLVTALLTIALCFAVGTSAFAQNPQNLVAGVGAVITNYSWANWTAMNRISGSSLIASSPTTRFYIGFTAGTTADISNMVLYTTARGQRVITAVTPVTLNGASNPSITLIDTCNYEISNFAVCIVPLDTLSVSLSPLNDYYLAIYFTNDSNNNILGVAKQEFPTSSLMGSDLLGNGTTLTVGQGVPVGNNNGVPHLLMYVQNQ
jgi:hypothetical protein